MMQHRGPLNRPRRFSDICRMKYIDLPSLAPTQDMLDAYKKNRGSRRDYEEKFIGLMKERGIEHEVSPDLIDHGCLLCSEDKPDHCHRRLVAEYLKDRWGSVEICHLG